MKSLIPIFNKSVENIIVPLSFEKSKNDIIQQGTLTFRGNLFRSLVSGTVPSRSSSDSVAIEKASTASSSSSTIKSKNPDIDSIPTTTNKIAMIEAISNDDMVVTVASVSAIPSTASSSSSSSQRQQYDDSKPIKLRIDKLQLRDVPDHGTFLDKQDPAVVIRVGKNNKPFETKRAKDAGANADYSEEFEIDIESSAFDSADYMVRYMITYYIWAIF